MSIQERVSSEPWSIKPQCWYYRYDCAHTSFQKKQKHTRLNTQTMNHDRRSRWAGRLSLNREHNATQLRVAVSIINRRDATKGGINVWPCPPPWGWGARRRRGGSWRQESLPSLLCWHGPLRGPLASGFTLPEVYCIPVPVEIFTIRFLGEISRAWSASVIGQRSRGAFLTEQPLICT